MIKKISLKLKYLLNHTSLWLQSAFLTILVTTCIILILIYNNYTSTRKLAINSQVSLSAELLEMEAENLSQYLMLLANFCIQPYYDSEFTRILNQKGTLSESQLSYVRQQMYYYYYTRSDLLEYELYLINQDISVGRTAQQQHIIIQPAPTFDVDHVIAKCSGNSMHHYIEPADSPAFFTYYHSLFQIKGQVQQSIVRLKVDTSYLKQFLKNHSAHDELIAMTNEEGNLIYTNSPGLLDDSSKIEETLSTRTRHEGYDTVKIENDSYLLVEADSTNSGLNLYCFTPVSYIDAQFHDIQRHILISGFLIWACAVSILYILLRFLTTPLKLLSEKMLETGDGNFHAVLHAEGNTEVVELSDSFNSMVSQIDRLIKKTYVSELSEKNARLTALEAQINPHFLYNTLQAISAEALENDQNQIHHMITALASNLRYSIKDAALISLSREMEYVDNYIFLQKMRHDDMLRFSAAIEPLTEECLIPKLSIHTLVENSILHGIDENNGTISIHVSAMLENEKIIIKVHDNGCGISKKQLETMQRTFLAEEEAGGKNSIGLANLYIRLHLLYDEPADMQIFSEEGKYTEIILTLPVKRNSP